MDNSDLIIGQSVPDQRFDCPFEQPPGDQLVKSRNNNRYLAIGNQQAGTNDMRHSIGLGF